VHAVQRQVREDFAPLWGMTASLRVLKINRNTKPNPDAKLSDVVIYVGELGDDPQSVANAVGYHFANLNGIPYGFVFTDVAAQIGEAWSTTLSHEVLELIADPDANLLVLGPHPDRADELVLRPYEVCDPVQGDIYDSDGVPVSNFVTPLYFAEQAHPSLEQTNFLNLKLDRFGVRPQGYFSYLDLTQGRYVDVFGDKVLGPQMRDKKARMGIARRAGRRSEELRSESYKDDKRPAVKGRRLLRLPKL
jgi:hypothetical protein